MSARMESGALRVAITTALAITAMLCVPRPAASNTCDPSYFPPADQIRYPNILSQSNQVITTWRFNQQVTNWAGVGVMAFDSGSDYDIALYPGCGSGSSITASVLGIGRTDVVIGDFNNDPTGNYSVDIYCYSGACGGTSQYGAAAWRTGTGSFLFVDFSPTYVNFTGGPPYSPDMVLHVYDVFLNQGTTYQFQFGSSLGSGMKMLLFRNPNPGGGTFYAGRNGADFEVSGCTSYTAPVTGYYGLVVVNDVWAQGDYTVGVFSTPQCACATELPLRTPVAVSSTPTTAYQWTQQSGWAWGATAVRPASGSDWDLEVSSSASSPGCAQTLLANSTLGAGATDFVASQATQGTFAARAYRYSGVGGATSEWDVVSSNGGFLSINNLVSENWGANAVLRCWQVYLESGRDYTFQFFPTPNVKLFVFRNPGGGLYAAGRNSAVLQASSTAMYTAPDDGYYGVVVVKDDAQSGYYSLRVGTCATTYPLTAGLPGTALGSQFWWMSIDPGAGSWHAVGSRSQIADWDLIQYGSTNPAAWPDCYTPAQASSQAAFTPDFIVGDFHYTPPGTYPIRAWQFSTWDPQPVDFEWTGAATPVTVNAPPIIASPDSAEVLRIYEAPLVSGHSYGILYTQTGNRPLLVFANPAPAEYWAPRGSALLSTTGSTSFTPSVSGVHAFVIANDAAESGSFSLQISSGPLAVGDDPHRFPTALMGARPNPGRSDVELRYSLERPARVQLELVDVTGRRVWSADEGVREAGEWSVPVRRLSAGGRVPAGLYFAHFVVDGRTIDVRKVTLID